MHPAVKIRDLLRKINKTLETILEKEVAKVGLTFPQFLVIRKTFGKTLTMSQISDEIGLSNSTVSGIVDRLERDGWIERIRCKDDRRVVRIQHTPKVQEIKKQLSIFQDEYYIHLLEEFSESQLEQTVETLELLAQQLEKKVEE